MNICKTCKHCIPSAVETACLCTHPQVQPAPMPSAVTGEIERRVIFCDLLRSFGPCGPDGRLWEAK